MGTGSIRPLYKRNSARHLNPYLANDDELYDFLKRVDVTSICETMMSKCHGRESGMMAKRLMLVHSYHAVARGGEILFQKYGDWKWDPRFDLVDTQWSELKEMDIYGMR